MFVPAINGVWIGYANNFYKRSDDSARVGVNRFLTIINQMASINTAIYIAEIALKASTLACKAVPFTTVVYLTPIITNILCAKYNLKDNPKIKGTLLVINNHISTICVLAVAVSSVALIFFGQPVTGWFSLAYVIAGFAQRRCWLPVKVSLRIDQIGFLASNFARIALGGYDHKFLAVCDVGTSVYQQTLKIKNYLYPPKTYQPPKVLINDNYDMSKLTIDPVHFSFKAPLPPPPNVNLKELDVIFKKFNLKEKKWISLLRETVTTDEHWLEFHANKNSDAQLIAYIKVGLENFISNINNRSIKSGEINDYRTLEIRAKHITHKLKDKPKEEQFKTILQLALASYECPVAYLEKVRTVYYSVCNAFEEDTLKSRIIQTLDQARQHHFQTFLYKLCNVFPKYKIILNPEDNHNYNAFINFLGKEFNLSESDDAKQDALSTLDIISEKILQALYKPAIRPYLNSYTKELILRSIIEGINNNQLTDSLLQTWFIDEYVLELQKRMPQAQNESERDYTDRLRTQARKWVFENVYDSYSGKIHSHYLTFLLLKMGFFKLLPQNAAVSEASPLPALKAEFDGMTYIEKIKLLQEFNETFPSESFAKPLNQNFVEFSFSLSYRILSSYQENYILALGQPTAWLLAIGKLNSINSDRWNNVAFSGDWWGICDDKGLEYVVDTKGIGQRQGPALKKVNMGTLLKRLDKHQPNQKQIEAYRKYLDKIGCHPHTILERPQPTVILDYIESGASLKSFLEILFEWAKELNINVESLKSKIELHLIYDPSFLKYFKSPDAHKAYLQGNFEPLCHSIAYTQLDDHSGDRTATLLLFDKSNLSRRLIKHFPCSDWDNQDQRSFDWNNLRNIRLIYMQILITK